ncbi:MAG: AAA family ATPase [Thermoleophilaceae bacterium]|nr:AAA family ATPase [Thermoleophilaceae bacterium]
MHLRSIAMKGFKSFPTRTKLEFGPGVSVIVGPNGSGKSNITDGVLWALGEQSPLAVRGQTMKDVIFAGGHGVGGSSSAEVEVVIDNSDGALPTDFSEISIVRRLDRDGEGEYRLNGARCRLVDVLEVLSDSGLGKEMHSVVSQGKVEQIVLSRPRERRLMIEEAAGLGKHRKRRRRAQLKLERTEENLSRALDVEREARSRLRPLKRQAEAAELHERLERQSLEARMTLAADATREARAALAAAEERAKQARSERDEAERLLSEVAGRREAAERAFATQSAERERTQAGRFDAGSAAERIQMRLERVRDQAAAASERRERRARQLALLEAESAHRADEGATLDEADLPKPPAEGDEAARTTWDALSAADRIRSLERELERLDADVEERRARELAGLEAELAATRGRVAELQTAVEDRRAALDSAERAADEARSRRREAERAVESARSRAADAGAELAALNRLVRGAGAALGGEPVLLEGLKAEAGFEQALAAALGARLTAAVVDNLAAGEKLLDGAGDTGATALVASRAHGRPAGQAPVPGATRLLAHVKAESGVARLAERLLGDVWVVGSLGAVSGSFRGVAVTRAGRLFDAATGELSQAAAGGNERLLEELGRRDGLVAASEAAAAEETTARADVESAGEAVAAADTAREEAEAALRRASREHAEAADGAERAEWLLGRRRESGGDGPEAAQRAGLSADLRAERRMAERAEQERAERVRTLDSLRAGIEADGALSVDAERVGRALQTALEAVEARRDALAAELEARAAAGEETAATLRSCAHEEAELQARLKRASEAVTSGEVTAQQARDAAADVDGELTAISERLGLQAEPSAEPLPEEERGALEARVERLRMRREQLGPVNPLAAKEYEEAVAHVEELEAQRGDLEDALAELESLIKETDRRIKQSFEETFEAAARNFEEVVEHLFPGGRGRLRLVRADQAPRPVVGGEAAPATEAEPEPEEPGEEAEPELGVEIEVTPPGKSAKRLSLLSGGEKSLVALAFMFAVFLARPCPFYILDEVEAALDDINIDRFLELVRRYADRAQFIVVTHQKRTMDAADTLYGVSMGGDGVSRVVSRKLGGRTIEEAAA